MARVETGVVVAAGLGTRLAPLTESKPKILTSLNDKNFLWYICKSLSASGVQHVHFCLGYKSDLVLDYLKNSRLDFTWDVVFNYDPKQTGCLDSMMMVPFIDSGRVIYFNSDLIIHPSFIKTAVRENVGNFVVTRRLAKVGVSETVLQKAVVLEGQVRRLDLTLAADFSHEAVGPVVMGADVFESMRRLYQDSFFAGATDKRCFSAIGMVLDSHPFKSVEVGDNQWFEINSTADLDHAKESIYW